MVGNMLVAWHRRLLKTPVSNLTIDEIPHPSPANPLATKKRSSVEKNR